MDMALQVIDKIPLMRSGSKSILTLLAILIAAIALPLLLLTSIVGVKFAIAERNVIEAQRLDVATNLSHLVDREIAGFTAFLTALASSPEVRDGRYETLDQHAVLLGDKRSLRQIFVTERGGKQLYPAADAANTASATRVDVASLQPAFAGQPIVSGYVGGGDAAVGQFFISVPIKASGDNPRVLSGGYNLEVLRGLFTEAGLPQAWISAVVDRNGIFLVRSMGAEELIGRPARQAVVDVAKANLSSGLFENVTLEGVEVANSFRRSPLSDWTSVVAVPKSILEAPLRRSIALLVATVLATTFVSLVLASLIARRISEPVRSLDAAANALAAGIPLKPPLYRVNELEGVWQAFQRVEKVTQERARYMEEFARRVAEEQRQTEVLKSTLNALQESEARYRSALKTGRMGSWVTNLDTKTREWSEEGMALFGLNLPDGRGQIGGPSDEYRQALHPDDRHLMEQFHKLADKQDEFDAEYRVVHPDGRMYWLSGRGRVVSRQEDGTARRIISIASDITERKVSEEKVRFLMREITHRSKNLLAVVQAIARQTARSASTFDEFQARFAARVQGLAASHDLLVNEDWSGASLKELINAQLALAGKAISQARLDGPEVQLTSEVSQGIGLALHELVANSLKYGALSVPEGVLSISWRYEADAGAKRVLLQWQERGGPTVTSPIRKGFGHTVIESMVAASTGGKVQLDFAPEGLSWTLTFPAAEVTAPAVAKA
jgi:PAS domain S-box-containing protein